MSTDDEFHTLHLRSFTLLAAVAREGSFSAAADRLGLNQSVVSYGIDKLRQVFDDPLFVRIAGQTQPTARCEELIVLADKFIEDFQLLRTKGRFDPATTTERLVIACNYYERMLFVPRAIAALSRAAPGLQIEIIEASGIGHEKLLNRDADLLIGPFQRQNAAFYTRTVATDRFAYMIDPAHPEAGKALTLERYLALDHILVTYGGRWQSGYLTELAQLGHGIDPAIKIPSPAGIEELVRGTRLVATLPFALARKIGQGLYTSPGPFAANLQIQLIWTAVNHHSEMLKWARETIAASIRSAEAATALGRQHDPGKDQGR